MYSSSLLHDSHHSGAIDEDAFLSRNAEKKNLMFGLVNFLFRKETSKTTCGSVMAIFSPSFRPDVCVKEIAAKGKKKSLYSEGRSRSVE